MSRALVIIQSDRDRQKACAWVNQVPWGTRIEFKATKRTLPQNDLMWSLLTDIADQFPWHGVRLRADDWKLIMLDALKQEIRMVPNLNGNGFVNLGRSSSDLSKDEMTQLIELIIAWGTQNGVAFKLLKETEKTA